MRVVRHMEETWQPEYSAKRENGWIDSLTNETDIPITAWRRFVRAEREYARARGTLEKVFAREGKT
jgi:hypothetical protein